MDIVVLHRRNPSRADGIAPVSQGRGYQVMGLARPYHCINMARDVFVLHRSAQTPDILRHFVILGQKTGTLFGSTVLCRKREKQPRDLADKPWQ